MLLITKHLAAMRAIAADRAVYPALRAYFWTPRRVPLLDHLAVTGHGQADVVLALLHMPHASARRHVEALVGRPIAVGPPCLRMLRGGSEPPVRARRRLTKVIADNPRVEPQARARFAEFRVGRTEEQLLLRGITRREITWACKQGWITMETPTHV